MQHRALSITRTVELPATAGGASADALTYRRPWTAGRDRTTIHRVHAANAVWKTGDAMCSPPSVLPSRPGWSAATGAGRAEATAVSRSGSARRSYVSAAMLAAGAAHPPGSISDPEAAVPSTVHAALRAASEAAAACAVAVMVEAVAHPPAAGVEEAVAGAAAMVAGAGARAGARHFSGFSSQDGPGGSFLPGPFFF
jgi:hypothetical protein